MALPLFIALIYQTIEKLSGYQAGKSKDGGERGDRCKGRREIGDRSRWSLGSGKSMSVNTKTR